MKKWICLIIVSVWGVLPFPLWLLMKATSDKHFPLVHKGLEVVVVGSHVAWFMPAFWIAHLFGVENQLYEVEILFYPKNIVGWILPVVIWFVLAVLLLGLIRKIRAMAVRIRRVNDNPAVG